MQVCTGAVQCMRDRLCSGIIDGPQTVLLNALEEVALAGVARLGPLDIPPNVSQPYDDKFSAPQLSPVDLLEDGPLGVDGAIRIATSPRPRAHPIRCKCEELAPLQDKGHMELGVMGLGNAAEADECLHLEL